MGSGEAVAAAQAGTSRAPKRNFASRLFGYDLFISFALGPPPRGTHSYASDLARRLRERDFTVFFSEDEAAPGEQLDRTLLKALYRSHTLVVIANRGTLQEPRWVRQEVEAFRNHYPDRPIIPISVGGALQDATLAEQARQWLAFDDKIWLDESHDAVAAGIATDEMVARLAMAPAGRSSNMKWRWVVGAIIATLVILSGAATWFGIYAQRQARIATARELVSASLINQNVDPELSVMLAMYSVAKTWTSGHAVLPESEQQLHQALSLSRVRSTLFHDKSVTAIAWAPDGVHVATGSEDGTTRVWDLNSGRVTREVRSLSEQVVSLSWSADGKSLVTGTLGGKVMVLNVEDGGQLLAFQASPSLSGLAWSLVSNRLATTDQASVNVWDAQTGEKALSLKLDGRSMSVAWSPDGKRLASGKLDGEVTVWDAEHGKKLTTLRGHDKGPTPVAWSPNGKQLLTGGGRDHTAKTWDVETGKELLELSGHTIIITSVAWSPDGSRLATASRDRTVKIWDAVSGKELLVLTGHQDEISGVAWSPDSKRLATASLDKTARVWDTEGNEEDPTLIGHTDIVRSVAWSPDGERLATSSRDGTARVWNAANGKEMQVLERNDGNISSVAWSPDGQKLAITTAVPSVWDARAGQHLLDLSGHKNFVGSVTWSPNGKKIATGSNDATVRIWDAASGQSLLTLPGGAPAWSPDSSRLAIGSAKVMIWNANNGKLSSTLSTSHQASVLGVAWSPDGERIAAAYQDGSTIIWSVGTEKELLTLTGHDSAVYAIAWSPDGKRLATGSLDHTAGVWDAASGARRLSLSNQNADVFSVAWSPDSKRLAVATGNVKGNPASGNDKVRVYAVDIHDLMALARRRVTRELRQEECYRYLHLVKCLPIPSTLD